MIDCQSTRDTFLYASSCRTSDAFEVLQIIADAVIRPNILEEEVCLKTIQQLINLIFSSTFAAMWFVMRMKHWLDNRNVNHFWPIGFIKRHFAPTRLACRDIALPMRRIRSILNIFSAISANIMRHPELCSLVISFIFLIFNYQIILRCWGWSAMVDGCRQRIIQSKPNHMGHFTRKTFGWTSSGWWLIGPIHWRRCSHWKGPQSSGTWSNAIP